MNTSSQTVEVVVDNRAIKQFVHNGRFFVEARDGKEYTIKVRNHSWNRVLAIVAVDGINVISGEISDNDGQGYIISPLSTTEIKGFRVSDEVVNQFKFSKKSQSYAAKSEETGGDTKNCGVIGVRIIEEKQRPQPTYIKKSLIPDWPKTPSYPYWHDGHMYGSTKGTYGSSVLRSNSIGDTDLVTCSCQSLGFDEPERGMKIGAATPRGFDMGTEFSDKEVVDKVTKVNFERGMVINNFEIFYASRPALEEFGIVFEKITAIPFPTAFQPTGYCKRPKR